MLPPPINSCFIPPWYPEYLYYNSALICLSLFANGRSQLLLDRLGRCLKLFVSTESVSCHEFASQFGLAIVHTRKTPPKNPRGNRVASASVYLNVHSSDRPLIASVTSNYVTVGRHRYIEQRPPAWRRQCVGGCVCASERACVRACVCVMCLQNTIIIIHDTTDNDNN